MRKKGKKIILMATSSIVALFIASNSSSQTELITFPGEYEEEPVPVIRGRIYPEALIGEKAVRGKRLGHYKKQEVIALLYHPDPKVRVRAARQVGYEGLSEYEFDLLDLIETDPIREVRTTAIASLGHLKSTASVGYLENLLADPSGYYLNSEKAAAAIALGNIPDSSVQLLADEVEFHPSPSVRAASVSGIKHKLPNPIAVQAIEKAKSDPHPLVKLTAMQRE